MSNVSSSTVQNSSENFKLSSLKENTKYSVINNTNNVFYNFIKECDFNNDGIIGKNELEYIKAFDIDKDGSVSKAEMNNIMSGVSGSKGFIASKIVENSIVSDDEVNWYLNYCEQKGLDCDDVKDLINIVNSQGLYSGVKNKSNKYLVQKLNCRLINLKNHSSNESLPETKFTEPVKFKQGIIGDCYFLSTIGKLSEDSDNRQRLQGLVRVDNQENPTCVYVKFPSMDEEFKISIENLQQACEFSSGNLYVRALEMAAENLQIKRGNSIDLLKANSAKSDNVKSPFDAGTMNYASAILFSDDISATKYANKSIAKQVYACILKNSGLKLDGFYELLGIEDCIDPNAYEYYHNPDNIKTALAEHKLVAAITSDLVNGKNQSGNHVCWVSSVDEAGNIYVHDPGNCNGKPTKYTPEEFKAKFPLVEISDLSGQDNLGLNDTAREALSLIPQHILSQNGTCDTKKFLSFLNSQDDFLDGLIKNYSEICSNSVMRSKARSSIESFIGLAMGDGDSFWTNTVKKAGSGVLTSPSISRSIPMGLKFLEELAKNDNDIVKTVAKNPGKSFILGGEALSIALGTGVEDGLKYILPEGEVSNQIARFCGLAVEWTEKPLSYILSGTATVGCMIWDAVGDTVSSTYDTVCDTVSSAYDSVCDTVSDFCDSVCDFFSF